MLAHSLALVADAGHNLSDVFGLLLAWGATAWARRPPTSRHTYGWRRSSILAALCNAVFLLVSVGVIGWEAVRRLREPAPVEAQTIIWVSVVGIVINTITALMFMAGRKGDLNMRAAFTHMSQAFTLFPIGYRLLRDPADHTRKLPLVHSLWVRYSEACFGLDGWEV